MLNNLSENFDINIDIRSLEDSNNQINEVISEVDSALTKITTAITNFNLIRYNEKVSSIWQVTDIKNKINELNTEITTLYSTMGQISTAYYDFASDSGPGFGLFQIGQDMLHLVDKFNSTKTMFEVNVVEGFSSAIEMFWDGMVVSEVKRVTDLVSLGFNDNGKDLLYKSMDVSTSLLTDWSFDPVFDSFFTATKEGQKINDLSMYKYDSGVAETVKVVSEFGTLGGVAVYLAGSGSGAVFAETAYSSIIFKNHGSGTGLEEAKNAGLDFEEALDFASDKGDVEGMLAAGGAFAGAFVVKGATSLGKKLVPSIDDILKGLSNNKVTNKLNDVFDNIVNVSDNVMSSGDDLAKGAANAMKKAPSVGADIGNSIKSSVDDFGKKITDTIGDLKNNVVSRADDVKDISKTSSVLDSNGIKIDPKTRMPENMDNYKNISSNPDEEMFWMNKGTDDAVNTTTSNSTQFSTVANDGSELLGPQTSSNNQFSAVMEDGSTMYGPNNSSVDDVVNTATSNSTQFSTVANDGSELLGPQTSSNNQFSAVMEDGSTMYGPNNSKINSNIEKVELKDSDITEPDWVGKAQPAESASDIDSNIERVELKDSDITEPDWVGKAQPAESASDIDSNIERVELKDSDITEPDWVGKAQSAESASDIDSNIERVELKDSDITEPDWVGKAQPAESAGGNTNTSSTLKDLISEDKLVKHDGNNGENTLVYEETSNNKIYGGNAVGGKIGDAIVLEPTSENGILNSNSMDDIEPQYYDREKFYSVDSSDSIEETVDLSGDDNSPERAGTSEISDDSNGTSESSSSNDNGSGVNNSSNQNSVPDTLYREEISSASTENNNNNNNNNNSSDSSIGDNNSSSDSSTGDNNSSSDLSTGDNNSSSDSSTEDNSVPTIQPLPNNTGGDNNNLSYGGNSNNQNWNSATGNDFNSEGLTDSNVSEDQIGADSDVGGSEDVSSGDKKPTQNIIGSDKTNDSDDGGSVVGTIAGVVGGAAALGGAAYLGTKHLKNKQKEDYYMDDSVDEETDNIIMDDTDEEESSASEILFNDNRIKLDEASNLEI